MGDAGFYTDNVVSLSQDNVTKLGKHPLVFGMEALIVRTKGLKMRKLLDHSPHLAFVGPAPSPVLSGADAFIHHRLRLLVSFPAVAPGTPSWSV